MDVKMQVITFSSIFIFWYWQCGNFGLKWGIGSINRGNYLIWEKFYAIWGLSLNDFPRIIERIQNGVSTEFHYIFRILRFIICNYWTRNVNQKYKLVLLTHHKKTFYKPSTFHIPRWYLILFSRQRLCWCSIL